MKLWIFSKTDFTFDQLQVCKTAREFCFVFILRADELVQICFHVAMGGAVPPGRQWIAYSLTGSGTPLLWLPSLGMQSHRKELSELCFQLDRIDTDQARKTNRNRIADEGGGLLAGNLHCLLENGFLEFKNTH